MQKFVHITDTHFVPPGNLLYGLNPIDRLALCVADINRNHSDAAFAILTGDLAHKGEPEAYAAGENYLPEGITKPGWYKPTPRGLEQKIAEKLAHLRELDNKAKVK